MKLPLTFSSSDLEAQLNLIRAIRTARVTRAQAAPRTARKMPVLKREKPFDFKKLSKEEQLSYAKALLGIKD